MNFLDTTLNLNDGTYRPYSKPNNRPLYIHKQSDHPPIITKNLPSAINYRLSNISSNSHGFEQTAPIYQEALSNSGYDYKLSYKTTNKDSNDGKRRRKIIWFNPPYSMSVATNTGKSLLKLVNSVFHKQHVLNKIFNANTLKVSYSCMPNISSIIKGHDRQIFNKNPKQPTTNARERNCRIKDQCPMQQKCLTKCVVYQAIVTTPSNGKQETYTGITEKLI